MISVSTFQTSMAHIKSGEILCVHCISNTLKVEVEMTNLSREIRHNYYIKTLDLNDTISLKPESIYT
jgi:hypothetical protein